MKKSRSMYIAVYRITVTGLAAIVLLSGKIFMVGTLYTAVKLYRWHRYGIPQTVTALITIIYYCCVSIFGVGRSGQKSARQAVSSKSMPLFRPPSSAFSIHPGHVPCSLLSLLVYPSIPLLPAPSLPLLPFP